MTLTITIDPKRPASAALQRAARVLAGGGLVVCPTETFYGLAADSASAAGLARLAALKGRAAEKAFPLIIGDAGAIDAIAAKVPAAARRLMDRYWPGPLTLVLPGHEGISPRIVGQSGGVGVRVSPHAVPRGLALLLGRAITATSANLAGGPPADSVASLDPAIAEGVDLILDAGPAAGGLASTVVDCTTDTLKILRPGPVEVPPELLAPSS